MLLDESGRRILAFGDSNTFGIIPATRRRYRPAQRWTGVLQQSLGTRWDVVESGLPGRTTDLEDLVFHRPDRAGWPLFRAVFESVAPDAVILALGTNDLRRGSGRTDPAEVAAALSRYVDHAVDGGVPASRIVIVAPAPVTAPSAASGMPDIFGEDGAAATRRVIDDLRRLADDRSTGWLDATADLRLGPDGAHLDEPSHRLLGERLAEVVRRAVGPDQG